MGLPVNDKNSGKAGKGNKGGGMMGGNSKFISKPGSTKAVGTTKKPIKTGGSRGS
jgi:hypothetical protein